jgi:ubiquitin-protein ligase
MPNQLLAQIAGTDGTPFEGGMFLLEVSVPDRYPFEPPKVPTPVHARALHG